MKTNTRTCFRKPAAGMALCTALIGAALPAPSQSNVDPDGNGRRYGWSENAGWMDLRANTSHGVVVAPDFLSGFAWLENVGWVNLGSGAPAGPGNHYSNASSADFGVNNDRRGNLSGLAWGENIGWISFDTTAAGGSRVRIDPATGRFSGHAWSENLGWISFDDVPLAAVATAPAASVPVRVSSFEVE